MKLIIFTLLIACISCEELFLPVNVIPQNYTSCLNDSLIHINKAFAMNKPTKGQNITFILLGTVSGLVQLKEVKMDVYLDGIPLTTFIYPDSSVFSPGFLIYYSYFGQGETFEYKFIQFLPTFTPSGTFKLHYEYMDVTGKMDGCTQVFYTLD